MIECIFCQLRLRSGLMVRWITERAGMKIKSCHCPSCSRTWTQYVTKGR